VTASGVADARTWFGVDVSAETLALTTAGQWQRGRLINLERSLKVGDELGGHLVSGHIDGVAVLASRDELTDIARLVFRAPPALMRFIAAKGSVALDGVSLTVNAVDAATFSVVIIPHTLRMTTLGALAVADRVNLEVDTMARYAARLADSR
jgi:riboflavin synthase